jgi:hypothetical protein
MDDETPQDQPQEPPSGGRVLIHPSTYSAPPDKPKRRSVPPKVGRIIGELGLRYRPSGQADLEAHAESIRLLSEDVADVPPHLLEIAARQWATSKPFMPKASELIGLARSSMPTLDANAGLCRLEEHCARLNQLSCWPGQKWVVAGEYPNRTVELR